MPIDLARVAALHEAALAAGLPGVLPDGYTCGRGHCGMWLEDPYGDEVRSEAAQAAVAWWLREWCEKHDELYQHFNRDSDLAWAEEIFVKVTHTRGAVYDD